jgi:hypothetical protein
MTEHERDDEIARRYRELPREEPPRAIDEAILAAARRELETRPDPELASAPPPAAPTPPAAKEQQPAAPPAGEAGPSIAMQAPKEPSPAPAAAASARPAPERDLADARREALSRRAESMTAKTEAASEPPEPMLKRIAMLRREGRHKEADDLYAEFRRRYPDYRIPEAMREQVLPR